MISKNNFIKKLIGMCVFQTAIILFYASIGVKEGATIPIYLPEHDPHGEQAYAAGGPEALVVEQVASTPILFLTAFMLTAIVVGVATLGLALALCQKFTKATVLWRKTSSWPSSKRRMPPISNPTWCYGQNRVQAQAIVSSQGGCGESGRKDHCGPGQEEFGPAKVQSS